MELTPELKRRFCKNCNIPISIFVEPFFTDRIKLFIIRWKNCRNS